MRLHSRTIRSTAILARAPGLSIRWTRSSNILKLTRGRTRQLLISSLLTLTTLFIQGHHSSTSSVMPTVVAKVSGATYSATHLVSLSGTTFTRHLVSFWCYFCLAMLIIIWNRQRDFVLRTSHVISIVVCTGIRTRVVSMTCSPHPYSWLPKLPARRSSWRPLLFSVHLKSMDVHLRMCRTFILSLMAMNPM